MYRNIWFNGCLFRGDNNANYGLVLDVADGGGFEAATVIENIKVIGGSMAGFRLSAVTLNGAASSKITAKNADFIGVEYSGNNVAGSANPSAIYSNIKNLTVSKCRFGDDAIAAANRITVAPNGASSSSIYVADIKGNNASLSNHSGRFVNDPNDASVVVNLDGNTAPGRGRRIDDTYKVTTTDATTTTIWSYIIPTGMAGAATVTLAPGEDRLVSEEVKRCCRG